MVESNHNFYNYEYENEDFIKPFEIPNEDITEMKSKNDRKDVNENRNVSSKSNESASLTKKLSFTERLELYERDMLNGFTDDLPAECYTQAQSQYQIQSQLNQSQESISLSDDEINYSMKKGAVHAMEDDDFYMEDDNRIYDYPIPSPIDFNLDDANSNQESDEKLMNQSVCNILEKTFDHCQSPIAKVAKTQKIGAKTLKKVNSEKVLGSRYGSEIPSTSTSTTNRVRLTPDKSTLDLKSPTKTKSSPFSQPIAETRTDLSNEEYIIHVGSVSPKPNYEEMDVSQLEMELRKFGLKPSLRRRQAIICLEYIYNRTHPIMENFVEIENSPRKNECKDIPNDNDEDSGKKINFNIGFGAHNLVDDTFKSREVNKIFLPSSLRAKVIFSFSFLYVFQSIISLDVFIDIFFSETMVLGTSSHCMA